MFILAFMFLSVVIILVSLFVHSRREKKARGKARIENGIALETMTENDLYESAQLLSVDTLNLLGCKEILEQKRVILDRQIGEGNFGRVFKG